MERMTQRTNEGMPSTGDKNLQQGAESALATSDFGSSIYEAPGNTASTSTSSNVRQGVGSSMPDNNEQRTRNEAAANSQEETIDDQATYGGGTVGAKAQSGTGEALDADGNPTRNRTGIGSMVL
ncbi:hypothetical protein BX600DRAFT_519395 [Xylariales sp. PMI_506]|nr:hypothetical protein BX600DRAFT_519395 [Xylariales sp. PMI_506]